MTGVTLHGIEIAMFSNDFNPLMLVANKNCGSLTANTGETVDVAIRLLIVLSIWAV